ncbi:MAG: PAS domain-containing protein [Sulfurospirillaceae bacterium]|nr:PAS domain-containing protein [Sulfurospirillaceae bacterium]
MKKELKPYIALCDAIGKLFYPNVEVVMHDLTAKTLVHIVNAFSKRRIGDAMLNDVKDIAALKEDWVGPYDKINYDGKRLKAVSIILRDSNNMPIGMICINYNTEAIASLFESLKGFLQVDDSRQKTPVLFSQSWREHMDESIEKYLSANNISLAGLSSEDKKALVLFLNDEGIFAIRNAVSYLCTVINVSRATIYNWLKTLRH